MTSRYENEYLRLIQQIVTLGNARASRVGPTVSLFGTTLPIMDLTRGEFPILTTRKMHINGIAGELAAFLRGAEDLATFQQYGCNYWDANALAWDGNKGRADDLQVGKIYGAQWRSFGDPGVDQIAKLVHGIEKDPMGRRHLLTTYDPSTMDDGCLPPCHLLTQFYVNGENLDCIVYMRSVDVCLGLPTDVALYAILLALVAQSTGYAPGRMAFMMGDTHIYHKHQAQVVEQYRRSVGEPCGYWLSPYATLDNFEPSMFKLLDYKPQDRINYALLA